MIKADLSGMKIYCVHAYWHLCLKIFRSRLGPLYLCVFICVGTSEYLCNDEGFRRDDVAMFRGVRVLDRLTTHFKFYALDLFFSVNIFLLCVFFRGESLLNSLE